FLCCVNNDTSKLSNMTSSTISCNYCNSTIDPSCKNGTYSMSCSTAIIKSLSLSCKLLGIVL
ncbi:hypothetical protein B566_EDAN010547, partial [Ephemera danica]